MTEHLTPIWQFVSPQDQNPVSAWAETPCPESDLRAAYQNGRIVLLDGTTGDPDVTGRTAASLERYVKSQSKRMRHDLLARMADTRFHLDLPIVEWRIAPNFEPVDLRFEFQRESMFRI